MPPEVEAAGECWVDVEALGPTAQPVSAFRFRDPSALLQYGFNPAGDTGPRIGNFGGTCGSVLSSVNTARLAPARPRARQSRRATEPPAGVRVRRRRAATHLRGIPTEFESKPLTGVSGSLSPSWLSENLTVALQQSLNTAFQSDCPSPRR